MKYKITICKECNNKIAVPTIKGLCRYHYKIERNKVYAERRKLKEPVKRKKTGELDLFKEIYDERPRLCFVTKASLDTPYFRRRSVFPQLFHHVLSKGAYPSYRLNKENIIMVHPEVHHLIETKSLIDLAAFNKGYLEVFALKEKLKSEYYGA